MRGRRRCRPGCTHAREVQNQHWGEHSQVCVKNFYFYPSPTVSALHYHHHSMQRHNDMISSDSDMMIWSESPRAEQEYHCAVTRCPSTPQRGIFVHVVLRASAAASTAAPALIPKVAVTSCVAACTHDCCTPIGIRVFLVASESNMLIVAFMLFVS